MDRAIVLGDSPFLNEVEHVLHYVLDKNYVIGINSVIKKCRIDLHAFTDTGLLKVTNAYPNIPSLTLYSYGALVRKSKKILLNTFTYKHDYCVEKEGKLAWCGFTHDYVMSYLITQGVKEIILLGAADFIEGKHYSNNWDFKRSKNLEEKSKRLIKDCCDTYCTIKTCNPNAIIEGVEYIPIESLLS